MSENANDIGGFEGSVSAEAGPGSLDMGAGLEGSSGEVSATVGAGRAGHVLRV